MSKNKCERCGSTKHCSSIFMDYRMNLVRLCDICHTDYHAMLIKNQVRFMQEVNNDTGTDSDPE